MKKILFLFVSMLAIVSCSTHDIESNQAEFMTNKYNAAFVKTFGQPAENQDWGFGTRVLPASFGATTRTANTNGNQWATDYGYTVPSAISDAELAAVLEVFNQKGEASYTSLIDWNVFFVQQVYKGTATYKNHDNQTVKGSEHMDWLCTVTNKQPNIQWWPWDPKFTVGTQNYDDHINNFNNGNCGANNGITLMVATDTHTFGFKSSEDNGHVFYNFRMEYIAPYGYFVGFDFEANGQNKNEQVDRDFIYNDWIVKIVPGYGTTTPPTPPARYTVRIICEDLYASEGSDFDFNDVVFDASYTEGSNKTTVTIQCAGGTLPLFVAGNEVHQLFANANQGLNIGTSTMINTNYPGGISGIAPVSFEIDHIVAPWDIDVAVKIENNVVPLSANVGSPASKIAVDPDFVWCDERDDIRRVYPNFSTYVQDTSVNWY